MNRSARLAGALAAIDRANAEDPEVLEVLGPDGNVERGPKELVHARMVSAWLSRLDPDADEAQQLAARAHHLRRWTCPRSAYPDGRAGYLRWRTAARRRHAEEVSVLLADAGYSGDEIEDVARIVRKEGLGTDPRVRTHEDALCLVFLEMQLGPLARRLGDDATVSALVRTMDKMSAAGRDHALGLELGADDRRLLERAVGEWARRAEGPEGGASTAGAASDDG